MPGNLYFNLPFCSNFLHFHFTSSTYVSTFFIVLSLSHTLSSLSSSIKDTQTFSFPYTDPPSWPVLAFSVHQKGALWFMALKPSMTIGTWEGFRASRFVHWVIWLVCFLQTLTSLSPLKEDGLCGEANCQCSSMRLSVFFAIRVWWGDSFSHHFSMALGRRQSKHMESIKPPEVPHSHSDLLQFSF